MMITKKRHLILSLTGILLAPCTIRSAAETENPTQLIILEGWTQQGDDFLKRVLQNDHDEEDKEDKDGINPYDLSDDEKELPQASQFKYKRRKNLVRATIKTTIEYATQILHGAVEPSYLSEADITAIKDGVQELQATPFTVLSENARSSRIPTTCIAHKKTFNLHTLINKALTKQEMAKLKNMAAEQALEQIEAARKIEHFPEESIKKMRTNVVTLLNTSVENFATVNHLKTSIATFHKTNGDKFNTGKSSAAKKVTQLTEQAQFAADMSGMGGLY